jgi:hypothetical protein
MTPAPRTTHRRSRSRVGWAVVPLALAAVCLPTWSASADPASPAAPANPAASAAPTAAQPGCQADRRTTVHANGAALGPGTYEPCVIDTGMTSGEAGLTITSTGTIQRSVATNPTGIAVSTDQGATWQRRVLPSGVQTAIADSVIDPATGRYFYTGALGAPIYHSDDGAVTWKQGSLPLLPTAMDWPKLFTGRPAQTRAHGYPNNVYYCNWTIPGGLVADTACFKSTDGGNSFTSTGDSPYRLTDCPAGWTAAQHGRGVVDPRDGTIYLPAMFCGNVEVAVSHDEGKTWQHRIVRPFARSNQQTLTDSDNDPANQRQKSQGRSNLVTSEMASGQTSDALAMDAQGRLFMSWIDEGYLPVVSRSADHGLTWSTPVRVSPPGVTKGVLPAIAVTRDGQVGLSYYATADGYTWTGYLTLAADLFSGAPTLQSAAVTRPGQPLMDQPCCWVSGLTEYTAARWAPDGSLWAAFNAYTPSGDAEGTLGRLTRATPLR